MNRLIPLLAIGLGLFFIIRKSQATTYYTYPQTGQTNYPPLNNNFYIPPFNIGIPTVKNTTNNTVNTSVNVPETVSGWQIPANGLPYKQWLDDASFVYDLPKDLLARVAYQESRFRPDIITGQTVSSAGAVGIMQIVPRYHPNVNPLDPKEAIYYAAKYLHNLYNQFGSWDKALAAYNWGPGNVANSGMSNLPTETANYITQILSDIGTA